MKPVPTMGTGSSGDSSLHRGSRVRAMWSIIGRRRPLLETGHTHGRQRIARRWPSMKFGVQVRPTAAAIDLRELGRIVEGLGFDSLWIPEHTHMPLDYGPGVEPPGDDEWVRTN